MIWVLSTKQYFSVFGQRTALVFERTFFSMFIFFFHRIPADRCVHSFITVHTRQLKKMPIVEKGEKLGFVHTYCNNESNQGCLHG